VELKMIKKIKINKNRGWRGLAEVKCYDETGELIHDEVFSYSEDMWQDLMRGYVMLQDKDSYYVLNINNTDLLPQHSQRSVTITNFTADVMKTEQVEKEKWVTRISSDNYHKIRHYIQNTNAHTTSDFNYVGIRVIPNL
jgi:hypothetical protein